MLNLDALNQLRQLKTAIQATREVFAGTVKATSGRFGFVALDDGRDIYLPQEQMQRVLPGDRVEVTLEDNAEGKTFAVIDRLLSSTLSTFVGKYLVRGNGHFVAPDINGLNRWIFLPPRQRNQAQEGDWLHCRLTQHPIKDGNAQAEVLRVIGNDSLPGIELALTLARHDISDHWPDSVLSEAEALDEQSLTPHMEGRTDLRDLPFVTIDAPSAQDMDDALFARTDADGWRLFVAIADPTALVDPDSAIGHAASARGTSMYFPGEVRPMLPDAISTGLCSLVAGRPRLALVCELHVQPDGGLGDFRLYEAVIQSAAKLSYEQVAALLDGFGDNVLLNLPDGVPDSLQTLGALSRALREWRTTQAILGEYRPDYRIRLDEQKKVRSIDRLEGTSAHRLVEECMVAANRCAAAFLQRECESGLFITHAGLRGERADALRQVLAEHCPDLANVDPTSLDGFRQLMNAQAVLPHDLLLRSLLVRQLERTELSAQAAPHQGMGLPAYTTMTSPLRKWLDFLVHRQIKACLRGAPGKGPDSATLSALQAALNLARQAMNEVEQAYRCQYLASRVGETAEGIIIRVLPAGFTVRLDDTGIEGFVSVKDLPGKYPFDPLLMTLQGEAGLFRLDQRVQVRVLEVESDRRNIRFGLA